MKGEQFLFVLDEATLDFRRVEYPPGRDQAGRLRALQQAVGGYVELVLLASGVDCYCDEDGLMKGRRPTAQVHRRGVPHQMASLTLVGSLALLVRANSEDDALESVERAVVPLRASRSRELAPPSPSER